MKLIKQISLWYSEGTSDKVYEVDLCEVGNDKFVVNFRYGRRGAALKDGTKTPLPVAEQEAQKIYNKLVDSKTKEGYREVGNFVEQTPAPDAVFVENTPPSVSPENTGGLEAFVFNTLQKALQPSALSAEKTDEKAKKWSLSRIIWRVGELRIRAAVPTLVSLLPKSDALQQYCICWSLGRCADTLAIPILQQIAKAAASKDMVKRMASLALLDILQNNDLQEAQNQLFSSLPISIQPLLGAADKKDTLEIALGKLGNTQPQTLYTLYLLLPKYPYLKETIKKFLANTPFKGNDNFKYVRYIYKAAEFRDDFELVAFASALFEFKKHIFSTNSYYVYADGDYIYNPNEELKKKNSKLAYSEQTRNYFIRRTWRTMRTLAASKKAAEYIEFAKYYLFQFTDEVRSEARRSRSEKRDWHYNEETRNWSSTLTVRENLYKEWAEHTAFNQILYKNSSRFELSKSGKAWKLKEGITFETPAPDTREEAFAEYWDAHPEAAIWLLKYSRCLPVHQFAVKVLKNNALALEKITYEDLVLILSKPYPETLALGIELAKKWYNPQNPNLNLALSLFHAELPEARALAQSWADMTPAFYLQSLDFYSVAISIHDDNRTWIAKLLKDNPISAEMSERVVKEALHQWQNMQHTEGVENYLRQVTPTFFELFKTSFQSVYLGEIDNLLKNKSVALQLLAAHILLNHNTPAENLPDGMIGILVNSQVSEVRSVGVTLFGKLPNNILLNNRETLKGFCLAHFPEIRASIRPIIEKLAAENPSFGREWADMLLPYFRMQEPFEGLHEDLLTLFTTALGAYWGHLDNETGLRLLGSSKMPRQVFGQFLLSNVMNVNDLSMRQILRLADHDLIAVRRWVIDFYEKNIARIKYESSEALRILDAKWDEVRLWSFDYFRRTFSDADWTPELLVFVCDSTRNDVQQFGKEMITKFFKEENGVDYLLKLSQHPSQNLQGFATHYLEQFATDKTEYIEKLEHYFITILSQVNRSGIAKMRIFSFLEQEALKNEAVAQLAANIMTRQSATIAVADKAATLRVMTAIKRKYPNVKMAMQTKPIAIRHS